MKVLVSGYEHRTGEHCASTALRNLLGFDGIEISEGMIVGLAGGLGFFYVRNDQTSPTRLFHGRTGTLEIDFCRNAGIPFDEPSETDDARAWSAVRERLDAGKPVMISTDTFYLGYHNTSSHFPGHRVVVVGYDPKAELVFLADRKFEEYQSCSFEELRHSRNSPDYAQTCHNQWGDFKGSLEPRIPLTEAVRAALARQSETMLTPPSNRISGIGGMRALAEELPGWSALHDWSWAARFGYQVVIKRGAGGSFFRSLYAEFLREAAEQLPALGDSGLPDEVDGIAARWRDLAGVLKEQSEREDCDPALFERAGAEMGALADAEEDFFEHARQVAADERAWR